MSFIFLLLLIYHKKTHVAKKQETFKPRKYEGEVERERNKVKVLSSELDDAKNAACQMKKQLNAEIELLKNALLESKQNGAAESSEVKSLRKELRTVRKSLANGTTRGEERSSVNLLRQFVDSEPQADDGFLSYEYGLCPPHPLRRLGPSKTTDYSLWEKWARELPHLYQTGKYIDYFDAQPVLSVEDLEGVDLLRANQILGLCAHATVHFAPRPRVLLGNASSSGAVSSSPGASMFEEPDKDKPQCPFSGTEAPPTVSKTSKSEAMVPPSILLPWKQVNARLGRPTPTFTYYDYFTLNVVPRARGADATREDADHRMTLFDPNRMPENTYRDLRCDIQVFGDQTENIFVLVNHDMEFQSKELVRLCCNAIDQVIAKDDAALSSTLLEMGAVVKRVTDAFLHAVPNSRSAHYCDMVSWSTTIGMLIPPILNGEMSMSGLQSSVVHLLDIFLGRYDYVGEMGELALAERPWLPSLHQEFFRLLHSSPSVREYVCQSKSRSLKSAFDRVVRLFGSEQGFLGAHRMKTMGFLELGMKVGRTESSGQTAKSDGPTGWQARPWWKINEAFLLGINQRMKLQSDPIKEGFTQALVQSIEQVSPTSESYKVTLNIKNAGISYKAGDRLEVLPENTSSIITRMLVALRLYDSDLSGSLSVSVDHEIWRESLSKFYPELSDQEYLNFPLLSILRIMQLRPLTRELFDVTCNAAGMKGHTDVENAFWRGDLNDVPDLIELLHNLAESSTMMCDALFNLPSVLCSILPPNSPRLYSIANSPPEGIEPSIVTIVVSKLWFEAESFHRDSGSNMSQRLSSTMSEQSQSNTPRHYGSTKTLHLGVCTSYLLRQSLFRYVPIRVAEEESFHLPSPPKYGGASNPPLFFIALGSGAAPIKAFLEELLDRDINDRPKEIYFCWGLRNTRSLIWLPILSKAIKQMGLQLCITFSGEPKRVKTDSDGNIEIVDGKKERVTTTLLHGDWPYILSRLAKLDGHFFLCGHPSLQVTFRAAVESALCNVGRLWPAESSFQYERLTAEKRLHSDCFFSGSIHDPSLTTIPVSEVARHNAIGDIWWIYKGCVYDVTEYMDVHPGGAKILFDKAGRDCTLDFEVAHGRNNLRVESAMSPYKIGNVSTGLSSSSRFPDRHAFKQAVTFLHTVSEIRNVYYLDVNMFPTPEECCASPHSINMRAKTAEKFFSSTLPLLISATTLLCDKLETQIPCSTLVSFKRGVTETLASFRKSLDPLIGKIASDGPYSPHPWIVTEICRIGCDFVSAVHKEAIEWLFSIEQQLDTVIIFPTLHATCRQTLIAVQQCIKIMNSSMSTTSKHNVFQDFLLPLGGRWRRVSHIGSFEQINFVKGDIITRKNDIHSLTFIILSGKVSVAENEKVVDVLVSGAVFGATTAPLLTDYTKHMLGNEVMKQTIRVESDECLVCILTSNQILRARQAFLDNPVRSHTAGIVTALHWRKALRCVKAVTRTQHLMKTNAIRSTSLFPFMDRGLVDEIAKASTVETIERGKFCGKDGDTSSGAWILVEGNVSIVTGELVVSSYSGYGTLFGEAPFIIASEEDGNMTQTVSLIATERSKFICIPRRTMETVCRTPLQRREAQFKWLKNLPFFSSLPPESVISLCHKYYQHQVKIWPTQTLYQIGEASDACYIVLTGCLELTDASGDTSIVKSGDCAGFDELFLRNSSRTQNCIGKQSSLCWKVTREALLEVMGNASLSPSEDSEKAELKDTAACNAVWNFTVLQSTTHDSPVDQLSSAYNENSTIHKRQNIRQTF